MIGYFNSRAREGATCPASAARPSSTHFNSRAREGATLSGLTPDLHPGISTHAPVRARHLLKHSPRDLHGISTHAPVRARLLADEEKVGQILFQLTRP